MRGLDDLVRQGKVLYLGISDAPAWWIAQANTLADFEARHSEELLTGDANLLSFAGFHSGFDGMCGVGKLHLIETHTNCGAIKRSIATFRIKSGTR